MFGSIIDEKIVLSEVGEIANKYWLEIPEHFPFIILDEYIIMPNHIHGIIVIDRFPDNVATCLGMSLQSVNRFSHPVSGSLATIINQFKGAVTRYARKNDIDFFWQPRYYDHIIRNETALNKIREYIWTNPVNWLADEEIIENLY